MPGIGAQYLKPGTEIFAVDPGKVIEVTYRSTKMMLIAHRWQASDRFTLIFLEKHRKPVFCLAGPRFDVVLGQLTSLKLRQVLSPQDAKEILQKYPLNSWNEVSVRDDTALKPFRALLLPISGVADEAFVHFDKVIYIVSFADHVSRLLSGGCTLLAPSSPNK